MKGRMSEEEFRAHCEQAKWWATADSVPAMTRGEYLRWKADRRAEMHRAELRRAPKPQMEIAL